MFHQVYVHLMVFVGIVPLAHIIDSMPDDVFAFLTEKLFKCQIAEIILSLFVFTENGVGYDVNHYLKELQILFQFRLDFFPLRYIVNYGMQYFLRADIHITGP